MDNDTKISKEQIESIKNELKGGSVSEDNLGDFLQRYLDREQSERVRKILSNPQKLREILSSPLAKTFMENYKDKE